MSKYIELSLKSAPMYAANAVELESIVSEDWTTTSLLKLVNTHPYEFVNAKIEARQPSGEYLVYDSIIALSDVSRITIVDKPELDIKKALDEIEKTEL